MRIRIAVLIFHLLGDLAVVGGDERVVFFHEDGVQLHFRKRRRKRSASNLTLGATEVRARARQMVVSTGG